MSRQKSRLARKKEEKAAPGQAGLCVNFSPDRKSVRIP
jgi:hypothetical protein